MMQCLIQYDNNTSQIKVIIIYTYQLKTQVMVTLMFYSYKKRNHIF